MSDTDTNPGGDTSSAIATAGSSPHTMEVGSTGNLDSQSTGNNLLEYGDHLASQEQEAGQLKYADYGTNDPHEAYEKAQQRFKDTQAMVRAKTMDQLSPEMRNEFATQHFKSMNAEQREVFARDAGLVQGAPEKYVEATNPEFIQELGFELYNENDDTPQAKYWNETLDGAKKLGMNEAQVKFAMTRFSEMMQAEHKNLVDHYGIQTNVDEQMTRFQQKFGAGWRSELKAIEPFANTMPQAVLNHGLAKTPEGIALLKEVHKFRQGPSGIMSGGQAMPASSYDDKRKEMQSLMTQQKSANMFGGDYNKAQERITQLREEMAQLKDSQRR